MPDALSCNEQLLAVAGEPGPYRLHQLVYEKFARDGKRSFIYTPLRLPSTLAVLVRGAIEGVPVVPPAAGQQRDFTLRALVTVKSREDNRRRPLERGKAAERLAWLARRAEASGFEILSADVEVQRLTFDRPERIAWLDVSEFSGQLRVTDAARFGAALLGGIGKGRAFGFGMLVLYGGEE